MHISSIQSLLHQIQTVSEKYNEILRITGESFNVFSILNMSSDEVRMHSALLGNLLDPNGSHACGTTFLDLFVSVIASKTADKEINAGIITFNTAGCRTNVEFHVGFTNEIVTEGGRIDILLRDTKGQCIIIENKIYAGDQKNQLLRYYNYKNNAPILYLTLDGADPSKESCGHLLKDTHFTCISYASDIIEWLELCVKEVATKPIIRESLVQYLVLIKVLTHQTPNNKMQQELKELILKNADNVKAMVRVSDVQSAVKQAVISKFAEVLKNAYEANKVADFDMTFDKDQIGRLGTRIEFISSNFHHKLELSFASEFGHPTLAVTRPEDRLNHNITLRSSLHALEFGKLENWGNCVWVNRYHAIKDYLADVEKWSEIVNGKIDILQEVLDGCTQILEIIVTVEEGQRIRSALETPTN